MRSPCLSQAVFYALLLTACADEAAVSGTREDAQITEEPDAGRMRSCGLTPVCVDGVAEQWMTCGSSFTQVPSAGLHRVCIVGEDDRLGVLWLRGDIILEAFKHSGYANGLVPSTLNAEQQERCEKALAALPLTLPTMCE